MNSFVLFKSMFEFASYVDYSDSTNFFNQPCITLSWTHIEDTFSNFAYETSRIYTGYPVDFTYTGFTMPITLPILFDNAGSVTKLTQITDDTALTFSTSEDTFTTTPASTSSQTSLSTTTTTITTTPSLSCFSSSSSISSPSSIPPISMLPNSN
jgi:hypothetical protein